MSDEWIFPSDSDPTPDEQPVPATAPSAPTASRRPRAAAFAGAALLAVGATGGALVAHSVWPRPSAHVAANAAGLPNRQSSGSSTNPFGYGGTNGFPGGQFGSGQFPGYGSNGGTSSGGSSTNSNGSDGPSDAAAVARDVDPGLVDITTTLKYEQAEAAGTGMVLTSTGEVLTNNHVIAGATSISVRDVGNNKTYRATVVGYDRADDVAVLQLQDASGLTTVKTATTAGAVGAAVVAVGNAGGTGGTPSYAGGSITSTDRSVTASDEGDGTSETLTGLLETDADVQAGDSGGPLVNTAGEVVGMDTAASSGFSFADGGGGDGYAIPIATALNLASSIVAGEASADIHIGATGMLGVEVTTAGTSSSGGATIAGVLSGGPAAKAGLSRGDVVVSIDGHAIGSANGLSKRLTLLSPGDTVTIGYATLSGTRRTATATLVSGPPQ